MCVCVCAVCAMILLALYMALPRGARGPMSEQCLFLNHSCNILDTFVIACGHSNNLRFLLFLFLVALCCPFLSFCTLYVIQPSACQKNIFIVSSYCTLFLLSYVFLSVSGRIELSFFTECNIEIWNIWRKLLMDL